MKKLFLFLFGLLLFTGSFASSLSSEVDFDTGIYIEQPQDFEVIVDVSATELELNFIAVDNSIKDGDFGFSPGIVTSLDHAIYYNESDLYFNKEKENYFYREIERRNRPPNMEDKTRFSANNYSNTKDGFINAMHKNIFGFWLC